jgi:hypothetical protein
VAVADLITAARVLALAIVEYSNLVTEREAG